MKDFPKKMIKAFCIIFMINSIQAQNELDIIGNWTVDSTYATVTFLLSQQEIDELMMMVEWGMISAEDFMDMMGFPMPTSQEEWDYITINGITMSIPEDEVGISAFSFNESQMGLFSDGLLPLTYNWSSDSTISLVTFDEDFPFTEFAIVSATNENLIMSSSITIMEEDGEFSYNIIFYCSNVDEFTLGCTDSSALNYNTNANLDDGSCEYPYPCTSNELLLTLEDDADDGWEGSELIINGTSFTLEDGDEDTFCIELKDCWAFYTIEGEYMDEASWTISDENDDIIIQGGLPYNDNDVDEDGECDDLKIEELSLENHSLVKVIDILGREHNEHIQGKVLFYIYENGRVIKKINLQ